MQPLFLCGGALVGRRQFVVGFAVVETNPPETTGFPSVTSLGRGSARIASAGRPWQSLWQSRSAQVERLDASKDQSRAGGTLSDDATSIDCVYIAASTHDARYTRICVASLRYFYPELPIRLLAGARLQHGLADELQQYWGVEMSPFCAGDYGWGFVKLEPLFASPGAKFLVLDSDTVLTGPVLDLWDMDAPFLVDDENQSEADTKRLYYDWDKVRGVDPAARPPQFVFNSGQWFGTAGVLTRDDFAPWVDWTMPRRLAYPQYFMPGDQGILNYALNQKVALDGLRVARRKILRWPGHGMGGLDADAISSVSCPPLVVHWAGMKKARQRDMVGADVLAYFENAYYKRLPAGYARKIFAASQDFLSQSVHDIQLRIRLASRKMTAGV